MWAYGKLLRLIKRHRVITTPGAQGVTLSPMYCSQLPPKATQSTENKEGTLVTGRFQILVKHWGDFKTRPDSLAHTLCYEQKEIFQQGGVQHLLTNLLRLAAAGL